MAKISPHPKPERPRHFIREWRKFRNLTQERLAERIDKTHGLISQIENGDTDYTQSTLEALADAMNCEPGDLLSRNPYMDGEVIDLMRRIKDRDQAIRLLKALTGTDG